MCVQNGIAAPCLKLKFHESFFYITAKHFAAYIVCGLGLGLGLGIQWNSSITDAIGNQHFVSYSEVSLTSGVSGIFPVGVVIHA